MTDEKNNYELVCVAEYIESQLEEMGAVKGVDYTVMDLTKLAMDQCLVNAINQLVDQLESLRFEMLEK